MFKISFKWGAYTGGVMTLLLLASHFLVAAPSPENYGVSEIYGYAAIFGSLGLIYLAVNDVQRSEAGQQLSLWQKIMIGVAVSAFAGVVFGLYNVVYTSYINPEFMENYYNYYISQIPEGPGRDAEIAKFEADKEMFMNPLSQFLIMGSTVLAAGIPESVLLALIHSARDKKVATA